ncbi:MAG: ATP-binding protein [Candidatus Sigynarchaeota archaeon]
MAAAQAETQKSYQIKINYHKCVACGDCVTACPVNLDQRRLKGYLDESNAVILIKNSNVRIINENSCTGCGTCIPACPVKAIDIVMRP